MNLESYYEKIRFLSFFLLNHLKCPFKEELIARYVMAKMMTKKGPRLFFNDNLHFIGADNCNDNVRRDQGYSPEQIGQIVKTKLCFDRNNSEEFRFSLFRHKIEELLLVQDKIVAGLSQEDEIFKYLSKYEFSFIDYSMRYNMDMFSNPEDQVNLQRMKEKWENIFELDIFQFFLMVVPREIWKTCYIRHPFIFDIISRDYECDLFVHLCMLRFEGGTTICRMYDHIDLTTAWSSHSQYDFQILEDQPVEIDVYFMFFLLVYYHKMFHFPNELFRERQAHVLQNFSTCTCVVCWDYRFFFCGRTSFASKASLKQVMESKNDRTFILYLTVLKTVFRLLTKCFGVYAFRKFREILIGGEFVKYNYSGFHEQYDFKGLVLKPISKIRNQDNTIMNIEKKNNQSFLNNPVICCGHWSHFKIICNHFHVFKRESSNYHKCRIEFLNNVTKIQNFWDYFCVYFNRYISNHNYEDMVSFWPNHVQGRDQMYIFQYFMNDEKHIGLFFPSGLIFKYFFNSYHKTFFYSNLKWYAPFPISIIQNAKDISENINFFFSDKKEVLKLTSLINSSGLDCLINMLNLQHYCNIGNGLERSAVFSMIINKFDVYQLWNLLVSPYLQKDNLIFKIEDFEIVRFSETGPNIYSSLQCFFSDNAGLSKTIIDFSAINMLHKKMRKMYYIDGTCDSQVTYLEIMPEMASFLRKAKIWKRNNPDRNYVLIRDISDNVQKVCEMIYSICASEILSKEESIELFMGLRSASQVVLPMDLPLFKKREFFDDPDSILKNHNFEVFKDIVTHLVLYLIYLSCFNRIFNLNLGSEIIHSVDIASFCLSASETRKDSAREFYPFGSQQFVGTTSFHQMITESRDIFYLSDTSEFEREQKSDSLSNYFFPVPIFHKKSNNTSMADVNEKFALEMLSMEKPEMALIHPKKSGGLFMVDQNLYNFLAQPQNCDRFLFII